MTPRQFFKVFEIPPKWFFNSKKKKVWGQVIKQYEQWTVEQVLAKKSKIQKKDAGPWYYVEAVRRQIQLEQHESYKTMGMASSVKNILKGIVG